MECLVTGAAGFIGSHLCERLLQAGHRVLGIDSFTTYYPRVVKERNLSRLWGRTGFKFHQLNLTADPIAPVIQGVEWVFHLAAMPGLVKSWSHFDEYHFCNIVATHRLLEAVKHSEYLNRFIYASTSSVYGRYASGDESLPLRPSSPYGVTKLAGEHLCRVFAEEYELPLIVLRYFSVYGPRQRPDMGYHRFIQAILQDQPIILTGDGTQLRGNTYISDCVEATARAVDAIPGETFNIGGGEVVSISEVIRKIERITRRTARIEYEPERPGDQKHTAADVSKFTRHTGWKPAMGIDEGLERQIAWHRELQMRMAA